MELDRGTFRSTYVTNSGPAFAHGTTGAKWTVGAPHPVHKNLPHTGPQCVNATKAKLKCNLCKPCILSIVPEISGTMLQCYVLTCGRAVTAFSVPPWSRRPGVRAPLTPPKASTGQTQTYIKINIKYMIINKYCNWNILLCTSYERLTNNTHQHCKNVNWWGAGVESNPAYVNLGLCKFQKESPQVRNCGMLVCSAV
jgi:hypothetical protein